MGKIRLKTRVQWGFYNAVVYAVLLAVALVPSGMLLVENPFAHRVKVMINGDVVALTDSKESAMEAYKRARLSYNQEGVRILDVDVSCEEVNRKDKDETIKGMHILREDKLVDAICDSLSSYDNPDKALAYTVRIDDYTVTVEDVSEVLAVLEKAQGQYDASDDFKVALKLPDNHNVNQYEVQVEKKDQPKQDKQETKPEKKTSKKKASGDAILEEQSKEDGVKDVRFSEPIQVAATYTPKSEITNSEETYGEMTEEVGEEAIYVVKPGDSLSVIAENNNMTMEAIRQMNPQIESDDDLYYDDRLKILVPTAAVCVVVEQQETYEEEYNAPVEYQDDGSMYIGESVVIQEGSMGTHIVTDLVTYTGSLETGREQLKETVLVEAVPQIVLRGTKSKPTYMYPVTNWNVTSTFGSRWGRLHAGTDVGIPVGTTVRASRGGQITVAGWLGGYGNCVMIDHGDGVTTVYGHLSQVLVSVGQYVDQGEQIALSGNTGRSTGPHLHFEIRVNGSATDATPYLEGTN